jgi:hypothetical protein
VHHWIIGTPFQYTAISFAAVGILCMYSTKRIRSYALRMCFTSLVILIMISRLFGLVSVEKSFLRREAAIDWDPSLSYIGYFASNKAGDAVFIAAGWGVATQIYCLSNGKRKLVYEPFYNYEGVSQLKGIIEKSGKKIIYILKKRPEKKVFVNNTAQILKDVKLIEELKEVPVDNEIAQLKAVESKKYLYITKKI